MFKINKFSPLLYTTDLEGTVQFYEGLLGFTLVLGNSASEWAVMAHENTELMFCRPNAKIPYKGAKFTGAFYFNIDKVEDMWAKLKDQVKICYPLEDFPYGMREFAIYDNNGYILQFGQDVVKVDTL